jgi:hypothetical protein
VTGSALEDMMNDKFDVLALKWKEEWIFQSVKCQGLLVDKRSQNFGITNLG